MRRILLCLADRDVDVGSVCAVGQGRRCSRIPCGAPARGAKLPPLLRKQLEAPMFQYPWQKVVYQDAAKVHNVLYSFLLLPL